MSIYQVNSATFVFLESALSFSSLLSGSSLKGTTGLLKRVFHRACGARVPAAGRGALFLLLAIGLRCIRLVLAGADLLSLSIEKDGIACTAVVIDAGNVVFIARSGLARCFKTTDERSIIGTAGTAHCLASTFLAAHHMTNTLFNQCKDIRRIETINVLATRAELKAYSVRAVFVVAAIRIGAASIVRCRCVHVILYGCTAIV